jgi:sterol desaturase/sphingolipid hydroxylase (fatty acid hydroxylase superfamily)
MGMIWLLAMLPSLILIALLSAGELLLRPGRADWWRNLQAWALQALAAITLLPLLLALELPSLLDGAAMPLWAGALVFVLLHDALEYFYHRAQHAVPLLWSMHSLHHSDPNMSALTTNRHFWGDQLIKAVTIWPLAALVIAPTPMMLGIYSMASLWHIVVHSRLLISFGPLSWLLNSPAYHRRHHSCLPEHYNSNFSALFPIFDVLCGSYNRPDGWPPTGLDREPHSLLDLLAWPVRQGEDAAEPVAAAR